MPLNSSPIPHCASSSMRSSHTLRKPLTVQCQFWLFRTRPRSETLPGDGQQDHQRQHNTGDLRCISEKPLPGASARDSLGGSHSRHATCVLRPELLERCDHRHPGTPQVYPLIRREVMSVYKGSAESAHSGARKTIGKKRAKLTLGILKMGMASDSRKREPLCCEA